MPKLLIIGDIGVDMVLGPVDDWPAVGTETLIDRAEVRSGFSAANAALAARHFGHDCVLVGAIGDDDAGRTLLRQLHGIDARLVAMSGQPTTMTVAVVRSDGERSFLTTRGHLESISWDDLMARVEPAGSGDIALLTGFFLLPALRAQYFDTLRALRVLGYRIAIDTGWPSEGWSAGVRDEITALLPLIDILLLNEIELLGLCGEGNFDDGLIHLASVMAPGAIAVAKLGARGAAAARDGQVGRGDAPEVAVFDSVGAGDSFNAAFLAALQNGLPVDRALIAGCAGASAIIAQFPRSDIAPGTFANLVAAHREDAL